MAEPIKRFQSDGGETVETLAEAAKPTPKDRSIALSTAPSAFYRALLEAKDLDNV